MSTTNEGLTLPPGTPQDVEDSSSTQGFCNTSQSPTEPGNDAGEKLRALSKAKPIRIVNENETQGGRWAYTLAFKQQDEFWSFRDVLLTVISLASLAVGAIAAWHTSDVYGAWKSTWFKCSKHPLSEWSMSNGDTIAPYDGYTMISSTVFTAATSLTYRLNTEDVNQHHFMFAGIASGTCLGLAISRDLGIAVFGFMPWTVLLGLISSITWHKCASLRRKRHKRIVSADKSPSIY